MLDLSQKTLLEITNILKQNISKLNFGDVFEFKVINPDLNYNKYSGYKYILNNKTYIHRSYKTYQDLAQLEFCTFLTPTILDNNFIKIRYKKLNTNSSFHKDINSNEKYGLNSEFFNINKNEEISFLYYYNLALKSVNINSKIRVLNLGVNKADEFEVINNIASNFKNIEFVGIDYSKSAIDFAKKRFQLNNFKFYTCDINRLDELNLGKFDLIITIGTLQSSNINFKLTFNNLIQNYLNKDASIILGFPNSRWIDGSMVYGAKIKNYSHSEISLIIKDIHYCKKYLQQKKYKVTISGKDYIFLWANKLL